MNSLQKNSPGSSTDGLEIYFNKFEQDLNLAKLSEVEITFKKLKFLGLNYDPFALTHSDECNQVIENLGLTIHFQNPYLATNILLRLLDKTEERLNNLKQ